MRHYKSCFQTIFKSRFPGKESSRLAAIEQEFELVKADVRFSKTSKNPMDRRMEIAGYFLATIKVLDKENIEFEQIRKIVIEIALEYVRPKNQFQTWLKQLPVKLIGTWLGKMMIKFFQKKVQIPPHPDGFRVNILTKKEDTLGLGYGFDILECGICKLFQKHDCQRFAPILCEVDYITSGLAGLNLVRSGTIANGAKKCDFRFEKIKA